MFNQSMYSELLREFRDIIPDKIFDAHAHIFRREHLKLPKPSYALPDVDEVSIEYWHKQLSGYFDAKMIDGLFFPYPSETCDIPLANEYLVSELSKHPQSRGLVLASFSSDAKMFANMLSNRQIVGFKPYYCYARGKTSAQSAPNDYIPEWAWQLAHEHRLCIVIHLVRELALADKDNASQIREKCIRYPGAKVILAHAARGFHAPNTMKGISSLAGLQNVFFDSSAVCEPMALFAVLKEFGPTRLLWGSDFPISELLGKCVTVGDGFFWLDPSTVNWKTAATCSPAPVIFESIRALKEAGNYFGLSKIDYKLIFNENASRMLDRTERGDNRVLKLYEYAKTRIPTGAQLMSKRPERYAPDAWPAYFSEARGCETWDIDGRHYYDMSTNGIGACLLGFRDPDVTAAVQRRINLGSMSTLNPPEEVELADVLCELHPWANQVRFGRSGGEIAAVAVRIARATTKRSLVAVCGYHGWHDWYLAANLGETDALDGHLLPGLNPLGVPKELRGTTLAFRDNDRDEFDTLIKKYGDKLAAVIIEPARHHDPQAGWLEHIRDSVHNCGALLIFDEITIGFRINVGGIHIKLGVNPDLAILAKALGNGHPIAAVLGTKESMAGAHQSFISSTYWTESIGPVAALATLHKMRSLPGFTSHLAAMGTLVQDYWRRAANKYNLPVEVEDGYPALSTFKFKHEQSAELITLYTKLMLDKGFLSGPVIYTTMGHTKDIMALYGQAIEEVFSRLGEYISKGTVKQMLTTPVAYSGFARLTR